MPVFIADLTPSNLTYTYTISKCFETIDFVLEPVDSTTFNVHVKTGPKRVGATLCKEAFLFANTEIFHPEVFVFATDHTLTFKTPSVESQIDFNFGGIKIFESCDNEI